MTTSPSDIAVVILNYNGAEFLRKFLPTVLLNSPTGTQIIVADNASSDQSVDVLTTEFPSVRIIRNKHNGGFAAGYNEALVHVNAKFLVLLNSDVEVTARWIEPIIEAMEVDDQIAAAQPKIRAYHRRDEFEYAGAAGGFIDKWGFPFCRGRIFDTYEKDLGQYDDTCEVFWATGACLFIRTSEWQRVKGFDADFFAHMEEIDLCWRLRNSGKKIMYCYESVVYHVGGGTLNKQSPFKTYLNFRNNLLLLTKNHAPQWFVIKLFLRMGLDGIAAWKFLLGGDGKHFLAVFHAHMSFYKMLPATLRKRKEVKQMTTRYAEHGVYNGSIVKAYFLDGKKKFSEIIFK